MKDQGTVGTGAEVPGKTGSGLLEGRLKLNRTAGSGDISRDLISHGSSAVSVSSAKNIPKRQNSASKSPRLARKMASAAKNSNVSAIPKKSSITSSSSSSSCEANSPKQLKPGKGKSFNISAADSEHFDKLKFADQYKINEAGDFSKTPLADTIISKLDRNNVPNLEGKSQLRLTTWKDISPTESKIENNAGATNERRSRPESGYFSNEVHSESREGMDGSMSEESDHAGTIKHRPKKQNTGNQSSEVTQVGGESVPEHPADKIGNEALVAPDATSEKGCALKSTKAPEQVSPSRAACEDSEMAASDSTNLDSLDVQSKDACDTADEAEEVDSLDTSPQRGAVSRKKATLAGQELVSRKEMGSVVSLDNSDSMGEQPTSQDEGSFNDYFFDEDFIVQFGGNLHTSVGVILQGSCAFSLAESMVPGEDCSVSRLYVLC